MSERSLTKTQLAKELELSTPVINIWDGVMVAPLIGAMDDNRAQQMMERLLDAIVRTASPMALLDITSIPEVDTKSAQYILDTVSASKMLDAEVILTGVSPAFAQPLVQLGIDMSKVTTRTTPAAGLRMALERQGVVTTRINNGGNS